MESLEKENSALRRSNYAKQAEIRLIEIRNENETQAQEGLGISGQPKQVHRNTGSVTFTEHYQRFGSKFQENTEPEIGTFFDKF